MFISLTSTTDEQVFVNLDLEWFCNLLGIEAEGGNVMRVEIERPNTIMFKVYPDKTDERYTKCLWARFTFDLANWSMTAQSDCGDYSYSWCVEKGGRTFLQLMTVIEKDYLLGKISSRSRFDVESTKQTVIEWVREDEDLSPEEQNRIISEINEIEKYADGQEFLRELEDIDGMDNFCDLWECLDYDYPASAKTFVEIFKEIVQPEIRKYLKEVNDESH